MDEIEDYSESIHEQSNEHAHHLVQEGKEKWVIWVALSTALIAVLAAITGLLAGEHADEAMLSQLHASDQWAFYQAKGIKSEILDENNKTLIAFGKTPVAADVDKIKENKKEQAEIKKKAEEAQAESNSHVAKHSVFARGITLFQISIAIGAISIIVKRRSLWLVSISFACIGIFFLIQGVWF
jgi:hypothetical protein